MKVRFEAALKKLHGMSSAWVLVCALAVALCIWFFMAAYGPSTVHWLVSRVASTAPASEPAPPTVVVVTVAPLSASAVQPASVPLVAVQSAASAALVVAGNAPRPADKTDSKASGPSYADLGQSGDAFGGVNALFAAIAGALVFWAGFVQARSLNQAKAEADKERKARAKQQFEATFFQLIELTDKAISRITRTPDTETILHERLARLKLGTHVSRPEKHGTAALDSLAATLCNQYGREVIAYDKLTAAKTLTEVYVDVIYAMYPSMLGPYFRLLYQTFKLISESELEPHDKTRYANIARGSISEGAVYLLAANGYSPRGHAFVSLIEEFGLLQHMHEEYREKCKVALSAGYRERAFMTSTERAHVEHDPVPLFGKNDFYPKSS